jgi:hypothetical protein
MKAVAAADEVAIDLMLGPFVPETYCGLRSQDIVHAHIAHFKENLSALMQPQLDQVFDDLLLAVDGDALAHQLAKIDVVQCLVEREMNAVVKHALMLHARAGSDLDEKIRRPLLEEPGADAVLDIRPAAILQYDGVDAGTMQKMREHEAGRTRPHDTDLHAHRAHLLAERGVEIVDEIIGILNSHRQPYERIPDIQGGAHLGPQGGMRHQRRVLDQALDPTQALGKRE